LQAGGQPHNTFLFRFHPPRDEWRLSTMVIIKMTFSNT